MGMSISRSMREAVLLGATQFQIERLARLDMDIDIDTLVTGATFVTAVQQEWTLLAIHIEIANGYIGE